MLPAQMKTTATIGPTKNSITAPPACENASQGTDDRGDATGCQTDPRATRQARSFFSLAERLAFVFDPLLLWGPRHDPDPSARL